MADMILFYRTPTSRIIDTADPANLPAGQKLEFTLPGNVWEQVEETFELNNKKFPIPTSLGGVKKMGVSPAGMKGYGRILRGFFKDPAAGIDQLRVFRKLAQVDSYHEFGVFGVKFPTEAAKFNVDGDPDNTFGWTFDRYTLKNFSILLNKVYDFSVEISWGGTLP